MKMRKGKLSERQLKIMAYLKKYIKENGYPPSIREIGDECDIGSTSVVNYNLNKLVKFGKIKRDQKIARGIKVVA